MKDHSGFTPEIGADMGASAASSGPDWATLSPEREVAWDGAATSSISTLANCKSNAATAGPLVFDATTGCVDATPYPATLTLWKYRGIYRGIYRVGDHQVGQWSAIVFGTVGA